MKRFIPILFGLVLSILSTSCAKMIDLKPEEEALADTVLQNKQDLVMLLNSCYDILANNFNGNSQNISEILSPNAGKPNQHDDYTEVYIHKTNFFNGTTGNYFKQPYEAIYRCNTMLARIDEVDGISAAEKSQFEGELKFIRGLCYFELIKKFAQPYGYTSDNSHPGLAIRLEIGKDPIERSSVTEVYDVILDDLLEAESKLAATNGNYATSYAAKALLAKVYFQMNELTKASQYAGEIISSGQFTLDTINRYGNYISNEAIFSTISSNLDQRSGELHGKYNTTGANLPNLGVSNELFELATLTTDDRRSNYYVVLNAGQENEFKGYSKFDNVWFNIPVLSLSDMILLKAEADYELNGVSNSTVDLLNTFIESRYINASSHTLSYSVLGSTLVYEIRKQRRLEFVGEGDWIDHLKRRGVNGESISIRNSPWDCPGMVIQIPISERSSIFELNEEGGC